MVLRALLTPRWLGALLLAALYAYLAYHLGHWQYAKHVAKVERNERIAAHYGAAPVSVESVLSARSMPLASEWTHVTSTGHYGTQRLVARGRPYDGEVGYEVLAPFVSASGAVVLVDRGWIPLGSRGVADVPSYAPPPAGQVVMTGWLRPGERSRAAGKTPGQIASINLAEASAALGTPLLGGYVQLETDLPPATASGGALGVQPLGRPDRSLGPHQAYAYQWWVSMPLGFGLIFFGLRRELAAAAHPEHPGDTRSAEPSRSKPKKVRIWDEEDA